MTIALQALHWWKRQSRSKFASHYAGGTNGVCECKMNVKSPQIIPTRHRMDQVSWSLVFSFFLNHLLEVGLTQKNHWETMALQMLTTVALLYFIACEDMHD